MKDVFCSPNGGYIKVPMSLTVARWGCGAHAGLYHLYVSTWDFRAGLPLISAQCVVDDFGDLVEVQR
jgi:hypothetical protein